MPLKTALEYGLAQSIQGFVTLIYGEPTVFTSEGLRLKS
jgi:hypothetical protein